MKKESYFIAAFISLLLLSIIFSPVSFADDALDALHQDFYRTYQKKIQSRVQMANRSQDQASIYNRQILVRMNSSSSFNPEKFAVETIEGYQYLKASGIEVVQVPEEIDYENKLQELNADKNVKYAEPDYIVQETGNIEKPKDPLFKKQWYLSKIDLLGAWKTTQGSEDVTIAVIDSGVDASHPDLKSRVLKGYDFMTYTKGGHNDQLGHGTQVAGIIGANANNIGIVGIDQEASILPIRAMGKDGTGSTASEIDSIYYAIEQEADIINMSYVIEGKNQLENEALWDAYDKGILLIGASGNYSTKEMMYPASYPQVLGVSATTKKDMLALFSNYGNGIDIAAPGESIYTTTIGNDYITDSGTSFSAPVVSGIAGLIKAAHPDWTPAEITYALEEGAKSLKGMEWDYEFGYGRVNAYQAIHTELPDIENEAGNESDNAIELVSGERVKDNINLPLDIDWYKFSLSDKTEVTIDLTNEAPHIDLVGVLYRETKDGYKKVQVIDDMAMGDDEQLIKNLKKGTYYLAVSEYHGRWSNDPYYIQVAYDDAAVEQQPYSDVTFYQKEIEHLQHAGIIRGYPDGTFRPKHNVTRLQAVQMILKEKGVDAEQYDAPNPHFKDLKPASEGYKEIAAAVDLGFVKGKDNNKFDPWDSLTRVQMAVMMTKAYGYKGESDIQFTDIDKKNWAYEPVQALVANDILHGYPDNTFKPYEPLSRQHFAVMMYRKMSTED